MNNPADWLRAMGKTVSPFGERVARLMDDLECGIYHIQEAAVKADWSRERWVEIIVSDGRFATFDAPNLTRLVFLSHEYAIRCEVRSARNDLLRLCFSPRVREGGVWERHPTIEQAVSSFREARANRAEKDDADK